MTFLPVDSRDIVAAEGPKYKVGPSCAAPFCNSFADHAHHVVRRSFLNGDYEWVKMPDGKIVGNLSPLCYLHHKDITENRTRIVYQEGKFLWDNFIGDPVPLGWQPPNYELVEAAEQEKFDRAFNQHEHVLDEEQPEKRICKSCGQRLPKPKVETPVEEKKLRRTWAVSVPVDLLEDGADTLDTLLEAAREELADAGLEYGQGKKVKFHILATSLGLFVQHSKSILSNA